MAKATKTAKIDLVYDGDELTVDDVIVLEDGTMQEKMKVLAKFVQNGDGEFMSADDGFIEIRKLSINQLKDATTAFGEAAKATVDPK